MISIKQDSLTEPLKKQLMEGFSRHAISKTGIDGKTDSVAFLAFDKEILVGAIVVEVFWGALHIKYILVEESYRGSKIGSKLMETALAFGQSHNCPFAFVETMSFQALGFYQKMGFVLEYTRSGYAQNTSFHYLRKDLVK